MSTSPTERIGAPTNQQDDFTYCKCITLLLEYGLYTACPAMCLGVLIPASITLDAINSVEGYIRDNRDSVILDYSYYNGRFAIGSFSEESLRTFDGDGTRAGPALSLVVSSIAMVFPLSVCIACWLSVFENHYVRFAIITSIFWFLFGISLLAGGIATLIYYPANNKLWSDKCSQLRDDVTVEICDDLFTVSTTGLAIACGILSLVTSLMYLMLCGSVTWNGYQKHKEKLQNRWPSSSQGRLSSRGQPGTAPPCVSIEPSTAPTMETSLSAPSAIPPTAPPSVQPSATPSVQPSGQPSVQPSAPWPLSMEASNPSTSELPPVSESESNAPPSYESTLTDPPPYETALTDTSHVD